MKKILFLLFALFVAQIYAIDDITYSANIDGRVVFKDSRVTIDVLDYPNNVINQHYTIQEVAKQEFLIVNNQKYLMLRSEVFLFLVDNSNRNIFFGISNSGKLMEFISPAQQYLETSYLEENGFRYIAKNMSYLKGNLPYVEGVNDFGKNQQITMNWSFSINKLVIVNGFISFDKPYLYEANNRIKKILIYEDNNPGYLVEINDTSKPQVIKLQNKCKNLKIKFIDIYIGTKYNDTCIAFLNGISADADLIK